VNVNPKLTTVIILLMIGLLWGMIILGQSKAHGCTFYNSQGQQQQRCY